MALWVLLIFPRFSALATGAASTSMHCRAKAKTENPTTAQGRRTNINLSYSILTVRF
jgi:hypothetical protein